MHGSGPQSLAGQQSPQLGHRHRQQEHDQADRHRGHPSTELRGVEGGGPVLDNNISVGAGSAGLGHHPRWPLWLEIVFFF